MVALGKRFFVHEALVAALPQRGRMALTGFLSALMRRSWSEDGRLYVDTAQRRLADECRVSVSTVQRYERKLVAAGLLRVARMGAPVRILELLDPSADRAVDNSVESRGCDEGHSVTGDRIIRSTVTGQNSPCHIPLRGSERSRQGRPQPDRPREPSAAQSADARQVARGIVHSIAQRLGDACTNPSDARPWRLGRRQTSEVEDRITRRLEAINRGAVSDLAVELTRRDVDRVVTYALKSPRPAAYVYSAITGGDWRCDPAPGSQAAKVKAAGKRAEMPVSDLASREGPPLTAEPPATAAERKALESILDAAEAPPGVRATAGRLESGKSVRDLTARLTGAWMKVMAKREVLA